MKHDGLGFEALLRVAARHFRDDEDGWAAFVERLPAAVAARLKAEWWWQAHGGQQAPPCLPDGTDWAVWVLMAGRGFGKTRAGAEWVWGKVRAPHPPTASQRVPPSPPGGEGLRIALVGATREDAVRVMVEGPSGLIAVARPDEAVRWVQTRGELELGRHARAFVYSAEAAEALRGPEHHFAWVDELGKWRAGGRGPSSRSGQAWDNLMMGMRLGKRPQVMVTTTPRSTQLMKRVLTLPGAVVTRGRTGDNLHLPEAFTAWMTETYGGTRLGRQELDGELIEEVEGSLFPVEMMEAARESGTFAGTRQGARVSPLTPLAFGESPSPSRGEGLVRIVVGVDPPASAGGDACGIVVCGQLEGAVPCFVVLADHSVAGLRPEGWARAVARAADAWGADRVVAEKNQGGEMVASVLRSADCMLPVKLVHASRGKVARAEPVAALMEAGRVKLAGRFPELEAEMNGLTIGGEYQGPGRSPDRADACVWALAALIEGAGRRAPRVVAL
jgi:phage terminase large subunit-like protein